MNQKSIVAKEAIVKEVVDLAKSHEAFIVFTYHGLSAPYSSAGTGPV